jgi:hypothetical protein
VSIEDGPDAGKAAIADAQGRYTLTGIRQGTFTIRATAPDHEPSTGSLVLDSIRLLDFELKPLRDTVTERVSAMIQPCNGETYIVCYAYPFETHHTGPVTATLTATGPDVVVIVDLHQVNRRYSWYSNSHRIPFTLTIPFCSGCPPDSYQLRIIGRLFTPVLITFTLTHPN